MRWIVGKSLKFRYLVIAIAIVMIYFGIGQINNMPVDVFPEFSPPMVEIQTPCLGLSPEEVEALVTIPLEQSLQGIPGLDVMRSKSVPQLSAVKMIFGTDIDLMLARQMVQERVALIVPNLPTWASPPVILPPLSATSRCMKIGISSEKLSVIDLSMITYWTIRQRIMTVPGVANVAIWGERLEMLQVEVVPELLEKHQVTLDEVKKATADALDVGLLQFSDGHHVGTGGWIDTPNQRLPIRHVLPIVYKSDEVNIDQLANIVLRAKNGKTLLLKDVAEVVIDHQPMIGDGIINDDIGLLLIVEKFPWGNTLQVTQGVEAALDAMAPGLPDIEIDSKIFRPATFIELSIDNLSEALLIASLLVILVLFLFLYEWRTALISAVAIPLSLMAGGLVLFLQGATINTMVLAGFVIALGAVVDDAIVDVENIIRRLREHRKKGGKTSFARIILEASYEVRHAIIFSTLIEVIALLPVFVMEGLSGAFFQPLALSYAMAVVASTVVALTVTPAMSYILLRNAPLEKRESPILVVLHRAYDWILNRIVRTPRYSYVSIGIVVLAGILVLPQLGQSLLPSFKERDFLMHWLTKPGTSWPEMNRITIQGSKELRNIPGVQNFGAHIGQALIMDEVVGMYFGENWISVDPAVDYDETLDAIQTAVDGYPGLREVLTGSHEAVTIRIYGRELDILRDKAEDVRDALVGIEGLIDLHVEFQEEIPQVEVTVDLEKAAFYGIKPGDVRRAATTLVASEEMGDIHIGHRTYDVNVWSVPEARNSLTDIENLLIDLPGGGYIKLKDVAEVVIRPTPNVIKHENLARRIDVGGNVKGRDLGSIVADVKVALAGVDFPHEYYPTLIGEYAEREAVADKMLIYAIIALIGIFFLLHTSFRSARLAILSFLLLPTALVGGVLAAFLGDGVISLGSLVGFLTVLGIAARNGILMINHFQHLEKFEGEAFGMSLVLRGARERLAPILMTATTTGLALIPLVVAGSIPGNEIELPMAVVILGGLVTSTLLNLFIIPPLYLRFGTKQAEDIVTEGA
jgi:CzcA family heavy metal efflux pump